MHRFQGLGRGPGWGHYPANPHTDPGGDAGGRLDVSESHFKGEL